MTSDGDNILTSSKARTQNGMLVGLPIIGRREANGWQQLYNLRHQQGLMQGGITITEPYATICKPCLIFTCCTERHNGCHENACRHLHHEL